MSLIGKKEKALRLPLRAVVCALLCLFFPMKSVDSSYLPVTGSNIGLGTSTPVAGLAVMNGNVGVGTWSPTARLQVVGTVSAANFVGDGSGLTGISSNSGWTDGGTNVYTSTTTDNVGIGTTTPIAKLQIAQDNDYNPSDSTSANQLIVRGIANPNNLAMGQWQPLVTKTNNGGQNRNYGLYLNLSNPTVHYSFQAIDCTTFRSYDSTGNITANQWTHVAMTYNGTALSLYMNGRLDSSQTISGTPCMTTDPLRISEATATYRTLYGSIDDVRIYNRPLSAAEIRDVYQGGNENFGGE